MPKRSSKNQLKKNEQISTDGESTEKSSSQQKKFTKSDEGTIPSQEDTTEASSIDERLFEPFEIDIIKGGKSPIKKYIQKQSTNNPKDHRSELDLLMGDVRESLKEKTLIDSTSQVLPGSVYKKKRNLPRVFQKIYEWVSQKFQDPYAAYGSRRRRSPLKMIIYSVIGMAVLYQVFIVGGPLVYNSPSNIPTKTIIPTFVIPKPYSLEFPGGWIFLLGESKDVYPEWTPTDAEWLQGTEICKLIAIPWSIQIDAVYKTFIKGDLIKLTMDNKDQYPYIVESLNVVSKDKLIELVNRKEPCMIIFLFKEDSTNWQVLSTLPESP